MVESSGHEHGLPAKCERSKFVRQTCREILVRPNAKLSVVIPAPTPDLASVEEGAALGPTGGELYDLRACAVGFATVACGRVAIIASLGTLDLSVTANRWLASPRYTQA
jgi:hypothetical protein